MKRIIFFAVLCFLSSGLAQAQKSVFKGELYVGAGGGASFSSVDFSPGVAQQTQLGFLGGVAAKYISEKHLGLIAEVNFIQRGWKEKFDPATDFSYNRTLNYAEIPLLWHIYFGNKTRFILNIGPKVSFLLNDKQQMSQPLADDLAARRAADPDARIGEQYMASDLLKRFDYGLVGGIGMAFKTGFGDFDVEGRYYFGFGDVFPNSRIKKDYFQRSAHRVIETKLTYYFKVN